MAGLEVTERDFFARQRLEDRQWAVCLALSFLLHAGLAAMFLFMSSLFEARLPVEEAVIVSLAPPTFDRMPELGEISSAPEPAAQTSPEPAEPEPAEAEPAASEPPPRPAQTRAQPEPKPEPVREQAPPEPPRERSSPEPEPAPQPASPPPEPQTRPQPAPEPAAPPPPTPAPESPAVARQPISLAPAMKQQVAKDTRLEEERDRERQEEEKKLAKELEQRKKQADAKKRQEEEKKLAKELEQRKKQADAKKRQAEERELANRLAQKQREADRRLREQRERAEQARQRAIAEGRSRQAAEEARRAEQAARRAEAEARAAREQLASMRGESRQTGATAGAPQAATGRTEGNPAVERQDWAQVVQRLESYWKLPDGRNWGGGLKAEVRITISSDGQVTGIRFDRKSGDPFFDQLVEKTIRQAAPMPRFPAVMRQPSTQLPVRFIPGNLGRM